VSLFLQDISAPSFLFQIHGTAMGTKMAVAFANLLMAEIETKLLNEIKAESSRKYGNVT